MRLADRLIAAVRVYQREISPKRPPCCAFEPTCSAYAVEALDRHGARRGAWLTAPAAPVQARRDRWRGPGAGHLSTPDDAVPPAGTNAWTDPACPAAATARS